MSDLAPQEHEVTKKSWLLQLLPVKCKSCGHLLNVQKGKFASNNGGVEIHCGTAQKRVCYLLSTSANLRHMHNIHFAAGTGILLLDHNNCFIEQQMRRISAQRLE